MYLTLALSNITKVYEKMMHSQLQSFLNKNKIISNFQFGFQNKHLINHTLISLAEMIPSTLDNDQLARGKIFNLQKAIQDSRPQNPSMMNHYRIIGIPIIGSKIT